MKNVSGNVFQMQRWSVNDGDGIRTTVFLKGCPLRCKWCANPESWNCSLEIFFLAEKCSSCGRCANVCPAKAISVDSGGYSFNRNNCDACGKCCEACPVGARKMIGLQLTIEEIMRVLKRDAIFYRESGGGVTFSGGEPFMQPDFLRQLVAACKRINIDTAIETSGYFDWEQCKDIIPMLDCVFVDIKHMNDQRHRLLTGVSNRPILENIKLISQNNPYTIIRVPLIDGVNADEKNIRSMCSFLQQHTQIAGIELLHYHELGRAKYQALGYGQSPEYKSPDKSHIEYLKDVIAEYGIGILDFS